MRQHCWPISLLNPASLAHWPRLNGALWLFGVSRRWPRGESFFGGSVANMSIETPPIYFSLIALTKSISLTMPPRAVLIKIVCGCIFLNSGAAIRFSVSAVKLQWTLITSALVIAVSKLTCSATLQRCWLGEVKITRMPSAAAILALALPSSPKPITAKVESFKSFIGLPKMQKEELFCHSPLIMLCR